MNADKYEAFLLAADSGSITAAAEALGYTQSGITRMIQSLEAELGLKLFLRTKKGVSLTENGKRLLPYFREISRNLRSIGQVSTEIKGVVQGSISIGSCYSIASSMLPELIKGFQILHPGITVNLMENGNDALRRFLLERSVDLCFCIDPEMPDVEWTELFRDEIVVWLPPGHPAAKKGYMELWELEKEPFIHTQPGQDTEIDRLLSGNGIKPDVRFTTLNAFTTYNMVAAGLGISVDQSLRSRDWADNVIKLPLRPRRYEAFGIAVPSGAEASPATRRFMEYVRKAEKNGMEFGGETQINV